MDWVKNHTCKNCEYSAKVDKSSIMYRDICILSNSNDAIDWCIYNEKEIPSDVVRCTCCHWSEDKEAIPSVMEEEKFTEDGLKYCSCGLEPVLVQSDYYKSGYDVWYVYCRKCGKQVVCESQSGAISLWNNKHAKE